MSKKDFPVVFHSSSALEDWDWTNPWEKGIGGSETSHIEMSQRLFKKGYDVHSYAPTPWKSGSVTDDVGQEWTHYSLYKEYEGILINYRNPEVFDMKKPRRQKWWFVAQDVAYDTWTDERLSKVDRYLCLCYTHARDTIRRHPGIKDRVYVSSNGIRSDYIKKKLKKANPKDRNPNRMLFPSSPDRGLRLLLEQWWRIREVNPDAELHVAYGFNNMEKIVQLMEGKDWRREYQEYLEHLLGQKGVYILGRINQDQLYDEWLKSGIWAHPTDFPETSCITCMDAQACGAFPVTNKYWAVGENVEWGWIIDGVPQKSELTMHRWLRNLYDAFETQKNDDGIIRTYMQDWALKKYDWNNIVKQWEGWFREDFKALNG